MNEQHEGFIRRCYELAVSAGKKGHDTFGAVLVHDGAILEEAENTADYARKIFGHAEFNLVHKCADQYPDDVLAESVLYTSCAPCERCLAAIASLGIRRVVCGVSYKAFSRLLPFEYRPLDREGLLARLGIRLTLTESVLEDEGMRVFEWWGGEWRPLAELIAEMDAVKEKNPGDGRPEDILMTPIGRVKNSVTERKDTAWGEDTSEILLDEPYKPGLKGLEDFSHAVILFHLDQARFEPEKHLQRRPRNRDDMPSVGIFSQRAKDRPNRIGLTAVEVVSVTDDALYVRGLDAVDGTPVLDIKPYYPAYDRKDAAVPEWVDRLMERYF